MSKNYPRNLILNVEEKEMFTVWAKKDPVDSMECEIYFKKSKKQKLKLRHFSTVDKTDEGNIKLLLTIGK